MRLPCNKNENICDLNVNCVTEMKPDLAFFTREIQPFVVPLRLIKHSKLLYSS